MIATIMELRAQISASEVELGALRTSPRSKIRMSSNCNPSLPACGRSSPTWKKAIPSPPPPDGNVLTPTSEVPAASLEYLRGMRDVRYQETLFEFMTRQYEMAKVDEAKQSQMIQVVDPALVPERRSWPPRTLLTFWHFFWGNDCQFLGDIASQPMTQTEWKILRTRGRCNSCANCCEFAISRIMWESAYVCVLPIPTITIVW